MKKFTYICLAGAVSFFAAQSAFARIGEKRMEIEKRMDSRQDGAYAYPREETLREALELPYNRVLLMQPYGSENAFYFKRVDGERTQIVDANNQTDLIGWEIHYGYLANESVMEFYQRFGDSMTIEELEGLMKLMIAGSEDVYWKRADFVPSLDRWDVEFKDGVPHAVYYARDGKKIETDSETQVSLKDLIPTRAVRSIYIQFQPKFRNASAFNKSVQYLIEEDAQREAFENYDKLLKARKEFSDDRTKRGGANTNKGSSSRISENSTSKRAVVPFRGNYLRDFESHSFNFNDPANVGFSVLKYAAPNVYVGGKLRQNRERKIQWTMDIPLQPDTSVGYNFVTSDGKMRALVYENAVLFINSEYDSEIRKYMEELYENQELNRKDEATLSLRKF